MTKAADIIALGTSDQVRNTSTPYVQLRLNGNSYMNAKAARLLGVDHLDMIRFYKRSANEWFIGKDPAIGATVRKNAGLYKFCAVKWVREVFNAMELDATRADFRTAATLEPIATIEGETEGLFLIPNPYNLK